MRTQNKRKIGGEEEKVAGEYLSGLGYEILEYNYFTKYGEIDIIAKDGIDLVFVEVKYRSSMRYGNPLEAVSNRKQQTIQKVALAYMKEHHLAENTYIRFDVVGIMGEQITVIKHAFGGM